MSEKFEQSLKRMRRIEGQVRGIAKMMEEERYCVDILQQFAAVEAALRAARSEVLKIHAAHCIHEAVQSGDRADQQKKFEELIKLFEKLGK